MSTRVRTTRTRVTSLFACLITLGLLVALAGCGSSDNGVSSKSASEILAASLAAANEASSVHIAGKSSTGQLSLVLNLDLSSEGGKGQISLANFDFEVIRIGSTIYLKGNKVFYARLAATNKAFAPVVKKLTNGAWLKAPVSGELAQLAAFSTKNTELKLLLRNSGPLTKGATITVNGQKAIELKQAAKLYKGSLFVATTGKPYPVQIVKTGREHGQITFSNWNAAVKLEAPTNVVDISKL